jgi:hypothetical protein
MHPAIRSRLGIALLLALMGGVRASGAAALAPAAEPRADATSVYVIRRRWHVDVGLPADSLEPPLSFLRERFPGARTLIFGFGDERYLLHGHRANILMVLWPGAGVILISALNTTPDAAFGARNVVALPVSASDNHALQEFIFNSIAVQDHELRALAQEPGGVLYFVAVQRYSGAYTCNRWAAQALEIAHLPIHSAGVEFAGQLWSQLQRAHWTPQEPSLE